MNKKELIRRAAIILKENGDRKMIRFPKQVFHISDDEGNTERFTVRKSDKQVIYTAPDIEVILDACLKVIMDAMKNGESVSLHGFGSFDVAYRKPSKVRNVLDGSEVFIDGHYVPKFACGNDLKRCAQVYEQSIADREIVAPPVYADGE